MSGAAPGPAGRRPPRPSRSTSPSSRCATARSTCCSSRPRERTVRRAGGRCPAGASARRNRSTRPRARELPAPTAARDVYLEQLYTFGQPRRDPARPGRLGGLRRAGARIPSESTGAARRQVRGGGVAPGVAAAAARLRPRGRRAARGRRGCAPSSSTPTSSTPCCPPSFTLGELQSALRGHPRATARPAELPAQGALARPAPSAAVACVAARTVPRRCMHSAAAGR